MSLLDESDSEVETSEHSSATPTQPAQGSAHKPLDTAPEQQACAQESQKDQTTPIKQEPECADH